MRAVVYDGRGGVRLVSAPEPQLTSDVDALVRVSRTAVCGTDLHLLAHPSGLDEGTVLGHEFVGEVVRVGRRVGSVAVGDVVVGCDYVACGRCWWCRSGHHWHCDQRRFFGTGSTFGPALAGAQADVVLTPFADTTLRVLPDGVDLDHALLLGDTLATGHAAARRLGTGPGATVVVVGGGAVGQLASLCAQVLGAGHVVVVEPVESRRSLAVDGGSLAVAPEAAGSVVQQLTGGRGADGVIDAVGAPVGLETALRIVRRGGSVVSVGVPSSATWEAPVGSAFERELTLGFVIGDFIRDADVLLTLLTSGLVVPDALVTPSGTLDDAEDVYAAVRARSTLKPVLRV